MPKIKLYITLLLVTFSSLSLSQDKKIAYSSNKTGSGILQIFIMNEDGSDKKQLTELDENCMKPKWSPDGDQIVFYTDADAVYLIRNLNKPDSVSKPVYVCGGTNPCFVSDGDEIMYNDEFDGVLSIFIIDTTRGSVGDVISDGRYSNMQTISSDGNKIVYSGFVGGTKSIMIADLDDTTDDFIKQVSRNQEANLEPDISEDMSKITYASFDNNLKGTIRIFEDDNETALSKGLPSSNVPRFSPDGSQIAFVVIDGSEVSLYLMNSDGSSRKDLNVAGGNVGTFQWIDNDTIVYDAGSETKLNIGVVNVKSGQSSIIADGGFNLHPCPQR